MSRKSRGLVAAFFALAAVAAGPANAQTGDKYTARLGMVPAANATQTALVVGKGSATAMLAGNRLTVNGSFEGLPAPATVARLHQGIARGASPSDRNGTRVGSAVAARVARAGPPAASQVGQGLCDRGARSGASVV